MSETPPILRSHLLISSPELGDANFARTVVLMIEHDEDGAMGVVLNRPLERSIADLWQQIHEGTTSCSAPVYWGGPVAGPLLAIHPIESLGDVQILPGVYCSTGKSNIDSVMHAEAPDLRFFIGCAGWSAGQLESEISVGAWQVIPATREFVFDGDASLWDRIVAQGPAGSLLSSLRIKQVPEDPEMN